MKKDEKQEYGKPNHMRTPSSDGEASNFSFPKYFIIIFLYNLYWILSMKYISVFELTYTSALLIAKGLKNSDNKIKYVIFVELFFFFNNIFIE